MKRDTLLIILASLVVVLLIAALNSTGLYADWLFFQEVGYQEVFLKGLWAKLLTGAGFGALALAFLLVNVWVANRVDFPWRHLFRVGGNVYELRQFDPNRLVKALSWPAAVLLAVLVGLVAKGWWQKALLYRHSSPVGLQDPLLGADLAFYLFELPMLEALYSGASAVLLLSMLLVGVNYGFRGGIGLKQGRPSLHQRAKRHLGLLAALWFVLLAWSFWLKRYGLLLQERGVLYGASYVDVHARLPALWVLVGVALLSAAGLMAWAFGARARAAALPVALLLLAHLVGLGLYPGALQSFKVSPNELVLEAPFIERHIRMTRLAYDLERISQRPFQVQESLGMKALRDNLSTIQNIRLWDEGPLLRTYGQLQQIRTYYRFADVDNDRYHVAGRYRQVMLSARELSYEDLPSRSWINEHLVFTHGIGLAMGPVSGITREGLPEFYVKDIPPASEHFQINRPEIYYGEKSNEYVVVGTKLKEFSYPTAEGNVYTVYEGSGGVRLGGLLRRAFFALHFGSAKLLLSTDITPKSRILYYRNVLQRVQQIAPFLLYDTDPYLVVSPEGRLYWLLDAYTHTGLFPYSKPIQKGVNYLRNPVKVVVDAYNGSVEFYLIEPQEPVAAAYGRIFPGLFRPVSEMPPALRSHVRYPRNLLRVQARMYALFHMTDPTVFYNKEDLWEIPRYRGRSMEPYYIIMRLPEGEREEFVLLLPFTPAKRDNLAAWMAARSDGEHYGQVVVYTFGRQKLVFGPKQVDARIDQDAYISQQLTLWGQRGSEVIRGSLLIIPIERSLLYVQPLYLVATERAGLPELRRVIVAYGQEVVMAPTLEEALQGLFEGRLPQVGKEPRAQPPEALSPRELVRRALQSLQKARQALKAEDWAAFGRYLREAEEWLRKGRP